MALKDKFINEIFETEIERTKNLESELEKKG